MTDGDTAAVIGKPAGIGHRASRRSIVLTVAAASCRFLVLAATAPAALPNCQAPSPSQTVCVIVEPAVTAGATAYPSVRFATGDRITVYADGCVQSGGHGVTWKRYVNPAGPNSSRLYHGLVGVRTANGSFVYPLQRFPSTSATTIVPKMPASGYLELGYEDDFYADNGYWSHDDGTGGQCSGGSQGYGGSAYVWVAIDHSQSPPPPPPPTCGQQPHSSPFDTLFTATGAMGEPLNPAWKWQCTYAGANARTTPDGLYPCTGDECPHLTPAIYPDAGESCNSFALRRPGDESAGIDLGPSPCSDEIAGIDFPSARIQGGILKPIYYTACHSGVPNTMLAGHANWYPATYYGTAYWADHSTWGDVIVGNPGDDDYNIWFETGDRARTVPAPPRDPAATPTAPADGSHKPLNLEFNAGETIDRFAPTNGFIPATPFWTRFHFAVDGLVGDPHQMIDGHDAVAFGLLGIDARHTGDPELHPVYALAIRDRALGAPVDLQDDRWAIFVRNSGTEGGCSQSDWLLSTGQVTLTLPAPAAGTRYSFGGLNAGDTRLVGTRSDISYGVAGSAPDQPVSGANVTVTLPDPALHPIAAGEISLRWRTDQPNGGVHARRAAGSRASTRRFAPARDLATTELSEPEELLRNVFARLTSRQRRLLHAVRPRAPLGSLAKFVINSDVAQVAASRHGVRGLIAGRPAAIPVHDDQAAGLATQMTETTQALCAVSLVGPLTEPFREACPSSRRADFAPPAHYWRGDGDVRDSVGHANGRTRGRIGYDVGPNGRAIHFGNPHGGYVDLGRHAGAFGRADFTLDLMISVQRRQRAGVLGTGTGSREENGSWWVALHTDGRVRFSLVTAKGLRSVTSTRRAAIRDRSFHRVTVIRRGRRLLLRVDGVVARSRTLLTARQRVGNDEPLTLGRVVDGAPAPGLTGAIAEIRTFKLARAIPGSDVFWRP